MQCYTCKFYKYIGAELGECRRFPPKPDGKGVHTVDEYSTVRPGGWCGEYKKKGAKK